MLSRSSSGSSALIASASSSFNEGPPCQSVSRSQQNTGNYVEYTNVQDNSEIINLTPSVVRGVSQSKTRTYAGKSRSFLMAVPIEKFVGKQKSDLDILGVDLADADCEALRESYSDLRLRWGVDSNEVCISTSKSIDNISLFLLQTI